MLGGFIYWARSSYDRFRLNQYRRQGLQIADDCSLMGMPSFGSEPYLISVGRHVRIAFGVTFITHDGGTFVIRNDSRYREVIKYGRITVHENCFIGYQAIIMSGVSIGPNSIVAAGAVVTKDVPPGTVVGGNPARVIRTLDSYAERSLEQTPPYDRLAYQHDKERELLRIMPRPW